MKICEAYAALLDPFVDGELSPAGSERVRAHLDACPACRAYVDDALSIRAAFPTAEDASVPEGFAQTVLDAVSRTEQAAQTPPKRRYRWAKALLPLAACAAIVILLFPLIGRKGAGGMAMDAGAPAGASPAGGAETAPAADAAAPEDVDLSNGTNTQFSQHGSTDREGALAAAQKDAEDAPEALRAPEEPREPGDQAAGASAVWIPADQAGLLEGYPMETDASGVPCWRLTAEEYDALRASLPEETDGSVLEDMDQVPTTGGEVLVYLADDP